MFYGAELNSGKCYGYMSPCSRCDDFKIGTDGRVYHVHSEIEKLRCIRIPAKCCPVDAILIEEYELNSLNPNSYLFPPSLDSHGNSYG